MKITMLVVLFCSALSLNASAVPSSDTSVGWVQNLSWNEIKKKAAAEQKPIFVDVFTTWCGPCKQMDKEVYTNDSLIRYFDSNFISVRMQMDQSGQDSKETRLRYPDAKFFKDNFTIAAYPTFLFFDKDGNIIHRETSFHSAAEMIDIAKKALDPNTQYYSLVNKYEKGSLAYIAYPSLIKHSTKAGNYALVARLKKDYLSYLATQPAEKWLNRTDIEIISEGMAGSKSIFYSLFTNEAERVNAVMKQSGYARRILDSIAQRSLVNFAVGRYTFVKQQPAWDSIQTATAALWGQSRAKRLLLYQKFKWYESNGDVERYVKYFFDLVAVNGLDTSHVGFSDAWVNFIVYNNVLGMDGIKKVSVSAAHKNLALSAMKDVVRRAEASPSWYMSVADTYACLLYSEGRVAEALLYEKKSLEVARSLNAEGDIEDFSKKIQLMKQSKPLQ